ncbi:ABC transporter ATP-binding protein/permease [Patescibacteria group bacterium]|nr:ABC transporter ATP-binding protein/permease [Patescibacteria group bacterium]
MRLLLKYLKRHWKLIALALFLATVNQIFSLLDPLIFRHIIDNYATKFTQLTSSQFFRGVSFLLLLAMGAAFVSRIAKNFQDYYVNNIIQRVGARLYADGVSHSLSLPYQVFEDQRSGETLGKLQQTRTDVEQFVTAAINVLFISIIGFIFVSVYAIRVNIVIAAVYFTAVPVIAGVSWVLSSKVKKIQKIIFAETTALSGSTTESLRNIELVKSLGLSEQEVGRLNSTTDKILQLELKKIKYIRSLSFIQGTIVNFMRICILFTLLYMVYAQRISFGQFFSLYIYSFFLFNPLQELGNIINTYSQAQASLNNFEQILQMPAEPRAEHPEQLGPLIEIAFKNVAFKHISAMRNALDGVSFSAGQGETVAFVGPSGAGKTTLVKLIAGLYRPINGQIEYNGKNQLAIDLNELRSQIGLVTQDTQLFAGTIRENLVFVNPSATDEECTAALQKAAAQTLMARAEKGLDTVIGEGGIKVSGGEKQRISIARALLRYPKLLIFDEATSALDSLTEQEISKTIRDVSTSKGQITILIAHRLSTIMHADRIYVLEKGKIVEQGKHHDLVNKKGLYYAMWRQQAGEE